MLEEETLKNIKHLSKSLIANEIIIAIFVGYMTISLGNITLYRLKHKIEHGFVVDFGSIFSIIFDVVLVVLIYFLCRVIKNIYCILVGKPQKSKYGQVIRKYMITKKEDESEYRTYYIDVLFEDNNTYIRKVQVEDETYEKARKNMKILVVSFNGRTAYGVIE